MREGLGQVEPLPAMFQPKHIHITGEGISQLLTLYHHGKKGSAPRIHERRLRQQPGVDGIECQRRRTFDPPSLVWN